MSEAERRAKWRRRGERTLSLALAVLWFLWASDSALFAIEAGSIPHAIYFVLHLLIAALYVVRRAPRAYPGRLYPHLIGIASTFYVFGFFPTPVIGSVTLGFAFLATGVAIALAAALSLGRSFGIRPVLRDIRTGGPYRIVRHPLYAGYMLMDIGLVITRPSLWNGAVAIVGAALYMWRARLEEDVLRGDRAYVEYLASVKRRFVPQLRLPGRRRQPPTTW